MYIQPTDPRGREPFILPEGYSGNAFRSEQLSLNGRTQESVAPASDGQAQEQESEHIPPNGAENETDAQSVTAEEPTDGEQSVPAMARGAEKEKSPPTGGLFSHIPFLSSLLPPPRKGNGKGGRLPEWVVIAAVILLLAEDDGGGDVLPFLLLLLLWD